MALDLSGIDLTKVPISEPPEGEVINLDNAYSRAWMTRVAVYTTLPLPVIFISLRVYARIRRRYDIGWDDCALDLMNSLLLLFYLY